MKDQPLTVDGAGFTYRRIVDLLDDGSSFAPLQRSTALEKPRCGSCYRHRRGQGGIGLS
jgi:hypothetical protein